MANYETAMLAYLKLAKIAQQKNQLPGRDRFLIQAGAAACRAGYLDISERCRDYVLSNNGVHVIGKSASFADAMRDEGFQQFLKTVEKTCPYERAEHLLQELGIEPGMPSSEDPASVETYAQQILSGEEWSRGVIDGRD